MPSRHADPPAWTIGPAAPGDLAATRALVAAAGLPEEGLEDQFPAAFVAARADGLLIGTAGLESHGPHGLLRSLAVAPPYRGRGLGEALVRDRLARARELGLASVHLLTTTAAGFFERLGFRAMERAAVPPEIRATRELAAICPETASVMAREVHRLPGPAPRKAPS
jgi:amino-acid N-acetyltransferase